MSNFNPRLHLGPIKRHIDAIARYPEGAFAYPTDQRNPYMTAACRVCGARCDRNHMRCQACCDAERALRCKRGHDFTNPANVRIRPNDGTKFCRVCDAERQRARRANRTPEQAEAERARDRERWSRRRRAAS
jgi:hypothetical protein